MNATVQPTRTIAGDPAWRVSGYETIRQLLNDPRLGRSHSHPERAARYSASVLFGRATPSSPTERQDHEQMRRLLSRSFSARRMALFRPRVGQLVDLVLDRLANASRPADFHELVSFPLPAFVISELLGVPAEDRHSFRRWSDEAADVMDQDRSLAGVNALQTYMRELLERKRTAPAEDVLSDLVAAQQRAPEAFSSEGAVQLAAGLLFAGHETTVAAIDKGMVLFLTNPAQREAIRRDATLVEQAVEEVLRCPISVTTHGATMTGGLPRYANADIDIDGTTIRAGDLVLLELQDANLDEHVFPSPSEFDIGRAENPHLAFGHGPHYCIGAPLARIELQELFGRIFQRFPTLVLADCPENLQLRTQTLTGGLVGVPVTW